jgi:hypothetical protein
VWPQDGAQGVPQNTSLDVSYVVDGSLVQEATGREISMVFQDPLGLFVPTETLSEGRYRVEAEPAPFAINFAGQRVRVELGSFAVGNRADEEPPVATVDEATYRVLGDGRDEGAIFVSFQSTTPDGYVRLELDVGDALAPLDGDLDWGSSWNQTGFDGDWFLADVDPETALVSARGIDVSGNVGEWSTPVPFDVVYGSSGGCRQAPPLSGRGTPLHLAILAATCCLVARRRARPSTERDRHSSRLS